MYFGGRVTARSLIFLLFAAQKSLTDRSALKKRDMTTMNFAASNEDLALFRVNAIGSIKMIQELNLRPREIGCST
jgi:hypothetical protein